MNKYLFFLVVLFLPLTCLHAQKAPNVIVFIADDLGWEDTNPYGNAVVRTPNIARLAQEGMRFDNFYLTASSCSPSRSSMFSGLYPHNTGAMNLHQDMKPEVELFPSLMKDAGYHTMLIGKSHGTNNPKVKAKFDNIKLVDWSKPWEMGDMWLTALNERPKDKPFFLWAASIDPHRPFKQGTYENPHNPKDVIVPPYLADVPEVRTDLADYYDEISRFDQHIGVVLKKLEEENILDNTIILVISDNGKAFSQCKTRINIQGLKSPLIVRYPSVVPKGSVSKSLVSAVDLAPTLLEMTRSKPLQKGQGKSFVSVLSKPTAEIRQYAYGEHNWHSVMAFERVVITKDFVCIKNWLPEYEASGPGDVTKEPSYQAMVKLYEGGKLPAKQSDSFISPRPAVELFDANKDRHCMTNLADAKKYQKQKTQLLAQLGSWQNETGDVFPGKDKLKKDDIDRRTGISLSGKDDKH